jgi:two-component system cell cycle response regulator DivK
LRVTLLSERPLVLLVEDDPDDRLLFAEWLRQAGFRVESAHNGLQALERAFDLLPDAILTDLDIPGIDGYELCRRLKSDPRTASIPILAVSGYLPFVQEPGRAERAGCDAFMRKPWDSPDVERTLKTLITEARGRRSA